MKTVTVSPAITEKINEAIRISLEFEKMTGKQLNITSTVGEIMASEKLDLALIVNDINECFDAMDKNGKKVQIKTRRYKGVESSMTGPLLDKNFEVGFDYAVLILLNEDYSFRDLYRIDSVAIRQHFDRINAARLLQSKPKRKTMSVAQFRSLSAKNAAAR